MTAQVPDKRTAFRIATMVETGLLRDDQYIPWADALVRALEAPPAWVLELCTTPYRPQAAALLREYAAAPPFESFEDAAFDGDAVACLLLRYRRGELTWATFLSEAGKVLDAQNGRVPCEVVYEMLNALERAEGSEALEASQRSEVERTFGDALARIEPLYAALADEARRGAASVEAPSPAVARARVEQQSEGAEYRDALRELAAAVTDEASFVRFLRALAADADADAAEAARRPVSPYGPGPLGWEHGTIGAFLDAAAAWAEDKRQPSAPNPWRACADILLAGKSYE